MREMRWDKASCMACRTQATVHEFAQGLQTQQARLVDLDNAPVHQLEIRAAG
jgi:hypothetical protein